MPLYSQGIIADQGAFRLDNYNMKLDVSPEIRAILDYMKSLQLSKPHAILVVGVPGSGKTFFAHHFSETFRAPFIEARKLQANSANDSGAEEILNTFLTEIAKTRQTFLFEPVLADQVTRSEFAKWARGADYEPLIVWIQTDNTTAERRAKKNGIDRDEYDRLVRHFNTPHSIEKPVVISGKHTQSSQTRMVLTRLSAHHPTAEQGVAVPARQQPGRRIDISRS